MQHVSYASMRARQFCVLTTTESWADFGARKMHLSPPTPSSLGCWPFLGGGSIFVDLLFYVLPIVCVGSVSLCPF